MGHAIFRFVGAIGSVYTEVFPDTLEQARDSVAGEMLPGWRGGKRVVDTFCWKALGLIRPAARRGAEVKVELRFSLS